MNPNIEKRVKDLLNLQMKADMSNRMFIGDCDYNRDFNVAFVEMQCETDEDWNKIISGLQAELKSRTK